MSKTTRILAGITLMILLCVPLFLLDVPRADLPTWFRYLLTPFYFALYALTMSYALRGYEATRKNRQRNGADA